MLILGKSLPYLQNAISSGLDSVSQGIVQTTQQQGIEALDKAINTFSISDVSADSLLGTQSQVSAPADFPDPTSFMGNQQGTGEVLTFLRDSTFRAGSELNNFTKNLSQHFGQIQSQVTPEQAANLNTMQNTLGRMSNLQQSLEAQLYSSRLGGAGLGLLQNSQLQKVPDLMSPGLTFTPKAPTIDNSLIAPKASNLFVKDGSDVNEVDANDVEHFRSGPPYIMASIAAVARQDPDLIKNMIRENTDGTYTVTFPSGRHVTVTGDFTTDFEAPAHQNEIWPLVIEKAVRQTTTDHSVPNILNLLTGHPVTDREALVRGSGWYTNSLFSGYGFKDMKNDFDAGKAIVLVSHGGKPVVDTDNGSIWNPGDLNYAFTVNNVYADAEGQGWVELSYPGPRPAFLPENPVPFDKLMELYRYSYTSQAHMKGTTAIEAGATNVNQYAQIPQVVPQTDTTGVIEAKTTTVAEKAREIK